MEKFIEVLNNDPKSKALLAKFNEKAKAEGLSGKVYEESRKTIVMMCMAMNRELIHQMADEVYEELNA